MRCTTDTRLPAVVLASEHPELLSALHADIALAVGHPVRDAIGLNERHMRLCMGGERWRRAASGGVV